MQNFYKMISNTFLSVFYRSFCWSFLVIIALECTNAINYELPISEFISEINANLSSVSLKSVANYSVVKNVYLNNNNLMYQDILTLTKGLPELCNLFISGNKITGPFDLGVLTDLKSFKSLNIYNNQIIELLNTRKGYENSIEALYFDKNNLLYINMSIFEGFTRLTTLGFSRNKIVYIDNLPTINTLQKSIKKILVNNNRWMCDHLKKFLEIAEPLNLEYFISIPELCIGTKKTLHKKVCCYESLVNLLRDIPNISVIPTITDKNMSKNLKAEDNEKELLNNCQDPANRQKTEIRIKSLEVQNQVYKTVLVVLAILLIMAIFIVFFNFCHRRKLIKEKEIQLNSVKLNENTSNNLEKLHLEKFSRESVNKSEIPSNSEPIYSEIDDEDYSGIQNHVEAVYSEINRHRS